MATGSISSIGLGSTLPVEDIISKLTDLEKAPLKNLEAAATTITARVSAYANIKSLVSTLSDAAAKLTRDSGWNGVSIASSNTSAVNATVTGIATASSFNVGVQQLAKVQTVASGYVPTNTDLGGTLTIDVGTWNSGLTAFSVGVNTSPVTVTIAPGETSLASVAAKINDANPNLSATVLTDATGQRLLIRSKATGEAAGFRIAVSNDVGGGLSKIGFDPPNNATGATRTQAAQDAKATINGVSVSSATNSVAGVIPGVTLNLTQQTTTDATLDIAADTAGMKKNIQDFVDAYNAVNTFLADATKYDADAKTAGLLQGDSTALGIANTLRMMLTTSSKTSPFANLGNIGISLQRGGALQIDATKLDAAMKTPDAVKAVFATVDSTDATSSGIGVKLKNYATALLSFDGTLNTKTDSLDKQTKNNQSDQDKVNNRATVLEARLRAQYTALDTKMASLTALSNFVTQQVTLWNNAGKS
jgi:flagellar hook-associated protein 2